MSAILLERDIIHYEALGRGKPVLFLHSWVGSWRYWIPMMQAISIGYRAYALDFYGFGDTSKSKKYSLDAQSELICGFLDRMGIGRVVLIGHGLGGLAGLSYALKYPEMVERMMMIDLPLGESDLSARLRNGKPVELAEALLGHSALSEPVAMDAAKTDPLAVAGSLADLGRFFEYGLWAKLASVPCLLVYGNSDPLVQAPDPEHVGSLSSRSHLIYFEGAGHFPMLDQGSKFARLINDFLALASGESPAELQLKEEWKRRVR